MEGFLWFFWLPAVFLNISVGVSGQLFEVTQNHSFVFTCPGTAVKYTCKATDSETIVQWIVEPSNGSALSIPSIVNFPSSIGTIVSGDITVEVVAVQPRIITTLTLVSSASGSFHTANVICRSARNSSINGSMVFESGESDEGMDPPGKPKLSEGPADFDKGSIGIKFDGSTAMGVDHYICNCSEPECEGIMVDNEQLNAILRVPAGITKKCYSVSVCAVDICGRESTMERGDICVDTIVGYTAVVFLFAFIVPILIMVIVILSVLTVRFYKLWKRSETSRDTEDLRLETEHKI